MGKDQQTESAAPPFYSRWVNVPFAPARWPFFYGWTIVAISTLSIVCSIPGQTAGIGLFTDYLIDALNITRNQLSIAYMIGTITSGLILPFAGKFLDRIGVRFMSLFASVGLCMSLLVLSNVDGIRDYLTPAVPWIYLPVAVASFAFLLIRFFGQGNMTMVGRVAMGRWFNYRRGLATAIAGIPVAFAFNAAPWILNQTINAFGWRQACWLMAAIVGGGMALIGFVFFRDNPEECGLTMDGMSEFQKQQRANTQLHTINHEFTRAEAVRTVSFWSIALGLAVHGLIVTAIAFHITAIGEEMGKSRQQAVMMFFYSSFISVPARFIISYLVDNTRLRLRWVLMGMSITTICYTFGLMYLNTRPGWWATTVCFGLTGGIWGVLCNVAFPRYFGRTHLGAVSGLNMSILVVASALGPVLFSGVHQWLGSYRNAAASVLILPVAVFAMALLTRNPQRKYTQ